MSPLTVTILDCGHGNLASVANALRAIGTAARISDKPSEVRSATCLIFPGQGSAPAAMRSLESTGLDHAFRDAVLTGVPTLGICLGMQLALDTSVEGPVKCLGLVQGGSCRFDGSLKVPQIGWNAVDSLSDPLFAGIPSSSYFYFVHSYYCRPDPGAAIGWSEYGVRYCSALRSGLFWATQFHPEKSGPVGLSLLANFVQLASPASSQITC